MISFLPPVPFHTSQVKETDSSANKIGRNNEKVNFIIVYANRRVPFIMVEWWLHAHTPSDQWVSLLGIERDGLDVLWYLKLRKHKVLEVLPALAPNRVLRTQGTGAASPLFSKTANVRILHCEGCYSSSKFFIQLKNIDSNQMFLPNIYKGDWQKPCRGLASGTGWVMTGQPNFPGRSKLD